MDPLRARYLQPIASLLYPEWVGTKGTASSSSSSTTSTSTTTTTTSSSSSSSGAAANTIAATGLDSHRAFVVKYATGPGEDVALSYHFDNAEVTLNVCLGRDFVGGALYFGPMKGVREELCTCNDVSTP